MSTQKYVEELFDTFGQLRRLLANRTQETHEERSSTAMQFAVLMYLHAHRMTTVGDVANHLKLSKSSATQLIDRMVRAGYLYRIEDSIDRRIIRLQLTDSGEQQLKTTKRRYIDNMSTVLSKIPESDLMTLVRIHRNLIKTLQEEEKQK